MKWTNWNALAVAVATYAGANDQQHSGGVVSIRIHSDRGSVAAIYGCVDAMTGDGEGNSVSAVRRALDEFGIEELGFGRSEDGAIWALVVKAAEPRLPIPFARTCTSQALARFLDDVVAPELCRGYAEKLEVE